MKKVYHFWPDQKIYIYIGELHFLPDRTPPKRVKGFDSGFHVSIGYVGVRVYVLSHHTLPVRAQKNRVTIMANSCGSS